MTPDEVSKVAQNDILVIQLGNQWMERVRGNILKRGSYTSQIMRLVARFLLNLRKIEDIPGNGEKSLWEYFKPEHFNLLVDAAIRTAVPLDDNLEDDALKSPSNAIKLGYDVKRVINGKIGLAIMKSDMESQKEAESLFKLMNIYWGSKVTKHARVILEERRFYAEKNLPLPGDIQRLNTHMQQAISHLDFNTKDSENFKTVGKLVEAKLVLYNRRRTGEVQAIRLADYARRTKGQAGAHLVGKLSKFEKHLLETQEVMTVRGKTGRPVPIILPQETTEALRYLTDPDVRKSAGVSSSNHYVFASQGDSIIWAYDALRNCAEAAMLQNPVAITSTNLRKYMATVTQVLDLKEHQMQWVLNHMGHTLDVHKLHYRATSDILERTQIAKILMLQDQGRVGEYRNMCLNDIDLQDIVFNTKQPAREIADAEADETNVNMALPSVNLDLVEIEETLQEAEEFYEPKRKPQKCLKKMWSEEEEKEIMTLMKRFFDLKQRPKPSACLKAIEKSKRNNGVIWKRKKDV